MEGIPYIDMTSLSQYKESEILLPRDLKITTIESDSESKKISEEHAVKVIDIKVEKDGESQFGKTPVGGKRKSKTKRKTKRHTKSKTKRRN
jgi:hypothetical protein